MADNNASLPTRQLPMPDGPGTDPLAQQQWILTFKQRLANWLDSAAREMATLQGRVSSLEAEIAALKAQLP